jgi:hypothetical protein
MKIHETLLNRYITRKDWTVYLDEKGAPVGFEHAELGDEGGSGGLWFDGVVLVDYDGVYSLPPEVISLCEKLGFIMDYAKEESE